MNPNLADLPDALNKIQTALSSIGDEKTFLLALQVCQNIDDVAVSVEVAKRRKEDQTWPEDLEEQKKWLTYFAVFRSRQGLLFAHKTLKQHADDPEAAARALFVIEQNGVLWRNKRFDNDQVKLIIAIVRKSPDISLKIQAAKALHAISDSRLFLQQELTSTDDVSYILELLKLVPEPPLSLLTHAEKQVRIAAAKALSKTANEEALLGALKVVQSDDWSAFESSFGQDTISVSGNFTLFRHRPVAQHDNRHAMVQRILDQLVQLKWHDPQFKAKVQQARQTKNPYLQSIEKRFQDMPKQMARFVGMPLYLPEDSIVARGLSDRKSQRALQAATRDLLLKGCGTSDISDESCEVDGSTWCRVGHIFSSPELRLFFDDQNPYFRGNNSVLIVTSGKTYNKKFLQGQARFEREGTFNTVSYNGYTKDEIEAIFLPQSLKHDIDILIGAQALNGLTTDTFRDLSLKELNQIRRHLLADSFYKKIHYDATVEGIQQATHLRSITADDILQETLDRAAARMLVKEELGVQAMTQVDFLEQDDASLKSNADSFMGRLSACLLEMQHVQNSHGHNGSRKVSVLEHTREVLFGEWGGFGLNTTGLDDSARILLRLAALFHDIGKLDGRNNHVQASVKRAKEELSKNSRFYGVEEKHIALILALIEHNDIFYRYTYGPISLDELCQKLRSVHTETKTAYSFETFCHMLLRLYLADASTLRAVQAKKDLYLPLITDRLCFETFNWLERLKQQLGENYVTSSLR